MLNEPLFRRVRAVYEAEKQNPTLTGEDAMLLQDTYDGFVRSGAALPEEKRGRYKEVKAELAKLSLQFSQNNIKETNDFVLHLTQREELAGLPESQIEQAAATAQERGMEGWVFTLHAPSFGPFMQYAENRALRDETLSRLHDALCARQRAKQLRDLPQFGESAHGIGATPRFFVLRRLCVAETYGADARTCAPFARRTQGALFSPRPSGSSGHRTARQGERRRRFRADAVGFCSLYASVEAERLRFGRRNGAPLPRVVESRRGSFRISHHFIWHYLQGESRNPRLS